MSLPKIDAMDKKILSLLDEDARMPEAKIGKIIGTSKQVIKYRIKRMEEKGIIENYYTQIDDGKTGFDSYYVFLQLTNINSKEEEKLYEEILKLDHIAWMITGVGRWDSIILFLADSITKFNEELTELKMILGKHLLSMEFTILVKAEHISYTFSKQKPHEPLKTTPKKKIIRLDLTNKKILEAISQNARMPVTEIARKTGVGLHKTHYRLKQLKKNKIIQGFKPKINIQKLGIMWYLLLITTRNVPEKRIMEFINYAKEHKKVYYITRTVGNYNIMIDTHVNTTEEFRKFLFEIKDKFEDVILKYESINVFEEKLITYLPRIVLEKE